MWEPGNDASSLSAPRLLQPFTIQYMLQPPQGILPSEEVDVSPMQLVTSFHSHNLKHHPSFVRGCLHIYIITEIPPPPRPQHVPDFYFYFFSTRPASHLQRQPELINCTPRRPKISATLASSHSTYSFSRQDTQCHAPSITISIDHSSQNQSRKSNTKTVARVL